MFNIPEPELPNCWKDDARINALYAPIRSELANTKDKEIKIESWKNLIYLYCTHNNMYKFDFTSLNRGLTRNGVSPACMSTVMKEMQKNGEIQELNEFLKNNNNSTTWSEWITNTVLKVPVSWTYNTLKRSLFLIDNETSKIYVHLGVIKKESQKLLLSIPEKSKQKPISCSKLLKLLDKESNDIANVKLLIHYLTNTGKIVIAKLPSSENNDIDDYLIKFCNSKQIQNITESEIAIYTLEENEDCVLRQIEHLEDEITHYVKEAKLHLSKNHRQMAKNCLKKKHEYEKRIIKKLNVLHNIQSLLEKLHDVHTNAKVLDSYKQALEAFNATYKSNGLNEDAVDETMINLGEMLDIHENIQSTISRPLVESDEDLEKELAELMKEEESSIKKDESIEDDLKEMFKNLNIDRLPKVPSANVSIQEASSS